MNMKIDNALVHNLIATQIPQWKNFPVRPVVNSGWDNRTFHLGEHMLVRMPSGVHYAPKIAKEFQWLPILAPLLPYQIPVPLVMGEPTKDYPWPWGVYRWLDGETVVAAANIDLNNLAQDLATFLNALYVIDPTNGPLPGEHSGYRGSALKVYDAEVRQAVTLLKGKIDADTVTEIWESALTTGWQYASVWIHGDIAAGNLLIQDGKLCAVIDFGGLAIGDPACDLAIAWTLFKDESRKVFRTMFSFDDGTWERGCAWALWKALIVAAGIVETNTVEGALCWHIIDEVIADHKQDH